MATRQEVVHGEGVGAVPSGGAAVEGRATKWLVAIPEALRAFAVRDAEHTLEAGGTTFAPENASVRPLRQPHAMAGTVRIVEDPLDDRESVVR